MGHTDIIAWSLPVTRLFWSWRSSSVKRKQQCLLWKVFISVYFARAFPSLWVSSAFSWHFLLITLWIQFSSVTQSCLTLCDPTDCSTPGLPVHHQLSEFTHTHVHWVSDVIQLSHPLSSPSLPAFNLSQHQGLFQWVSYSHQVAKGLEFQLPHQSFQWIFRIDLL